jgi:hypothetical protein
MLELSYFSSYCLFLTVFWYLPSLCTGEEGAFNEYEAIQAISFIADQLLGTLQTSTEKSVAPIVVLVGGREGQ